MRSLRGKGLAVDSAKFTRGDNAVKFRTKTAATREKAVTCQQDSTDNRTYKTFRQSLLAVGEYQGVIVYVVPSRDR